MTTTWLLSTAQTVIFLCVVGWAWWATNRIEDACEHAEQAADDADRLIDWWHRHYNQPDPEPPTEPTPVVRTDTNEVSTVITPQAVTEPVDPDVEAWARAEVARMWGDLQPQPPKQAS